MDAVEPRMIRGRKQEIGMTRHPFGPTAPEAAGEHADGDGREPAASARYRVDRFVVPEAARAAFLDRVAATSRVLHRQPGFVRELVLEQSTAAGASNFVTVVEWRDAAAIEQAALAVGRAHAAMGFDRRAFTDEHGIRAEIGTYGAVVL